MKQQDLVILQNQLMDRQKVLEKLTLEAQGVLHRNWKELDKKAETLQ